MPATPPNPDEVDVLAEILRRLKRIEADILEIKRRLNAGGL